MDEAARIAHNWSERSKRNDAGMGAPKRFGREEWLRKEEPNQICCRALNQTRSKNSNTKSQNWPPTL